MKSVYAAFVVHTGWIRHSRGQERAVGRVKGTDDPRGSPLPDGQSQKTAQGAQAYASILSASWRS